MDQTETSSAVENLIRAVDESRLSTLAKIDQAGAFVELRNGRWQQRMTNDVEEEKKKEKIVDPQPPQRPTPPQNWNNKDQENELQKTRPKVREPELVF